jgi:hypothetical protein
MDAFAALTDVGGAVSILYNYLLTNVSGLSSLQSVCNDPAETALSLFGCLTLRLSEELTQLDGFGSLSTVGGSAILELRGTTDWSAFDALTTVSGDLLIEYYGGGPDFSGFDALTTVAGKLTLKGAFYVESISGFNNLSSVSGLSISSMTILTTFPGLASLSEVAGDLSVGDNRSLASLADLTHITTVAGDIAFTSNAALPDCEIQAFVDGLTGFTGALTLDMNDSVTPCQ